MALVISSSAHKSRSSNKPWMLKDYLLEDLGSCSSNGFRSFPRRQCCAAVKSLIEHEVRSRGSAGSTSRRLFNAGSKPSRSSTASSKISRAIRRASMAIISAVKLLPFKSPATAKAKKKTPLQKSVSGSRLFRKKLWKKAPPKDNWSGDCDIERWISSGAAAAEKYQPSDLSNATTASTTVTITSASTASGTNSDGWSESDSELTHARSSVDENGAVEVKRSSPAESKRCRVTATAGGDSVEAATTKKKWNRQVEKEQLSPISVLKFPGEDGEVECSPSFAGRLNNSKTLLQKLKRFSSRNDPINLETRLSPPKPTEIEETVNRMIGLVRAKKASSNVCEYNVDSLLVGFFTEGLIKRKGKDKKAVEENLLCEAEEWVSGRRQDEVSVGWRRIY